MPSSVSIIVPTYNRASLVTQAVDSLLAQTRVPDEIIVVNDGSKDDTEKVLQKYQRPVKVIKRENGGLSAARNTGLKNATGDLIAFLDDDDTLTPNSIELRASYLEAHPEIDVVYGDIFITDLEGNPQYLFSSKPSAKMPSGDVFAEIICSNLAPVHAYMLRSRCISNMMFDTTYHVLEDYDLFVQLAAKYQFQFLNEVVGTYRYHPSQMRSTRLNKMRETEVRLREKVFLMANFSSLTMKQQSRAYSIQATRYMLLGDAKKSRHWYYKAISANHKAMKNYLLLILTFLGNKGFKVAIERITQLRSNDPSKSST